MNMGGDRAAYLLNDVLSLESTSETKALIHEMQWVKIFKKIITPAVLNIIILKP